jgi:hypothetical protein
MEVILYDVIAYTLIKINSIFDLMNEAPITEVNEALRAIDELRLSFHRKDDDSEKR